MLAALKVLSGFHADLLLPTKRTQAKKRNAAVIGLARRRYGVIFAVLKHATPNDEKPVQTA